MSQVEITVRGRHTAFEAPQRATAHLTIARQGPTEQPVNAGVAEAVRTVAEQIQPLHDPEGGPLTWWSSDQLRTWTERPHHSEGKQLPPVFHATVDVSAEFADFGALSRWLGQVLQADGVRVDRVGWALTTARQQELTARVRTAAVTDARDKAQSYADALSLGPVTATALADAGMLGGGVAPPGAQHPATFARAAPAGGGDEVRFEPQDIAVSAEVDARFLVG